MSLPDMFNYEGEENWDFIPRREHRESEPMAQARAEFTPDTSTDSASIQSDETLRAYSEDEEDEDEVETEDPEERESRVEIPADVDSTRYEAIQDHVAYNICSQRREPAQRDALADLYVELAQKVKAVKLEEEKELKEIDKMKYAYEDELRDMAFGKALIKGAWSYWWRTTSNYNDLTATPEARKIFGLIKDWKKAVKERTAEKELALFEEFKAKRIRLFGRPLGIDFATPSETEADGEVGDTDGSGTEEFEEVSDEGN